MTTTAGLQSQSDPLPPAAKRARLAQEDGGIVQQKPPLQQPTKLSTLQEKDVKSEFPLRNLEEFYKTCPTYRLPVEVGSFSLDEKGKHRLDRSQLKYFSPPVPPTRVNFDLKVGYAKYVPSPRSVPSDKLNPILRWIAVNGDCFRPKQFNVKSPDKGVGNGGVAAGGGASGLERRVSIGEVIGTTVNAKDRYVMTQGHTVFSWASGNIDISRVICTWCISRWPHFKCSD